MYSNQILTHQNYHNCQNHTFLSFRLFYFCCLGYFLLFRLFSDGGLPLKIQAVLPIETKKIYPSTDMARSQLQEHNIFLPEDMLVNEYGAEGTT